MSEERTPPSIPNEIERGHDQDRATPGAARDSGMSERFIRALDRRLEQSELAELGWKGRQDLNDVLRDLERLAAVDFERASNLWAKYRPDDKDKPPFLDSDELAAEKTREPAASRKNPTVEPDFVVPEGLRKRFIQADDKYYFRHDDNKLAFQDHGHKIATLHDDPVVALSMVQLAEAKGWQQIQLKGTEEFRREAWLQASLKGMEARGYTPRDVDLAKLAELERELGTTGRPARKLTPRAAEREPAATDAGTRAGEPPERGAIVDEPQRSLTPQQRIVLDTVKAVWRKQGASEEEVEVAAAATVERFQHQRVYVGTLAALGEAPFENDPKNEKSFFVKLTTPKGDTTAEKVVWGVDLRRALDESGIEIGDEVVIANQGRQPVNITVKDRDADGKIVGTSTITTNRNTWRAETLQSLREEALDKVKAKAAQADRAPLISIYDREADRSTPRPEVKIEKARDQERSR